MSKVWLLRIFCNPRSVFDPRSSDGLSNGSQETGVERKVVGAVIQYIYGLMLIKTYGINLASGLQDGVFFDQVLGL
jgi:hypothetical protein